MKIKTATITFGKKVKFPDPMNATKIMNWIYSNFIQRGERKMIFKEADPVSLLSSGRKVWN